MTSKRKFAGNDKISRKGKFMKLGSEKSENSEKSEKCEKSEKSGTSEKSENSENSEKSETNNQTDIFEQNSDIFEQNSNTEPESLLKIKCEADLDKPRQIIAPIIAINPKSKNGYSFVHEVSMVLTRPNSRGIKEHFSHENEK